LYKIKLNNTAKLLEIKGYEKHIESLYAQKLDIPKDHKEALKKDMEKQFDITLKRGTEALFRNFPDKAIGVDDEWVLFFPATYINLPTSELASFKGVKCKCKVTERKNGLLYANFSGKATVSINRDNYTRTIKAKLNGNMIIDEKTGLTTKRSIDIELTKKTSVQSETISTETTKANLTYTGTIYDKKTTM